MEMLQNVFTVASSFGDGIFSILFFYVILRPEQKVVINKKLVIIFLINFCTSTLLSFMPMVYLVKSIIIFIIDFIICSILSDRQWGFSFCLPAIYFGLLYICESVVPYTLIFFYKELNFENVEGTSFLQVYGTLVSRGILYLLLAGISYLAYRKKDFLDTRHLRVSQWICFGGGIALLCGYMAMFSYSQNDDPQWMDHVASGFPFIFTVLLIILLVMFVSLSRESEKKYQLQSELVRKEQRLEQSKTIRSLYEKSRGIQHDFKNNMQVLSTLADAGRLDEIKKYLQETLNSAPLSTRQWIEVPGDPTVTALLNAKFSRALESGIRISAEIWYPNPMHILTSDLCTILFNVLDNAIEACEKNQDPEKRRIRIVLKQKGYFFGVLCDNPSEIEPTPDKKHRFRSYKKGSLHGVGMRQLQQMANKYNGAFDAKYENGIFSVRVVLANSPCKESYISTVELPYRKPE